MISRIYNEWIQPQLFAFAVQLQGNGNQKNNHAYVPQSLVFYIVHLISRSEIAERIGKIRMKAIVTVYVGLYHKLQLKTLCVITGVLISLKRNTLNFFLAKRIKLTLILHFAIWLSYLFANTSVKINSVSVKFQILCTSYNKNGLFSPQVWKTPSL